MSSGLPIQPLQVLYERASTETRLPEPLQALYGGGLELEEPRLYANFVATVDGVVAVPSLPRSNQLVAQGDDGDRFVMGLLRALADCVLIGAGTLAGSPHGTWLAERVFPPAGEAYAALRRQRGRAPRPEIAILTGQGSIDPDHPVLAGQAVVLTSEGGAQRLDGLLPSSAELVAIGEGPGLDLTVAVDVLRGRGHSSILSEAGPHTFGSLVAAGMADELFLTLSPLLLGEGGPATRFGLVQAADLLPEGVPTRLVSVRRHEQHLFLRYEILHLSTTEEVP